MKRRKVIGIAIAVVAAHLVAFWLVSGMHVLPKREVIPRPNFAAQEATVVDPKSGDKFTVHEYTVSTKLEKQTPPADQ